MCKLFEIKEKSYHVERINKDEYISLLRGIVDSEIIDNNNYSETSLYYEIRNDSVNISILKVTPYIEKLDYDNCIVVNSYIIDEYYYNKYNSIDNCEDLKIIDNIARLLCKTNSRTKVYITTNIKSVYNALYGTSIWISTDNELCSITSLLKSYTLLYNKDKTDNELEYLEDHFPYKIYSLDKESYYKQFEVLKEYSLLYDYRHEFKIKYKLDDNSEEGGMVIVRVLSKDIIDNKLVLEIIYKVYGGDNIRGAVNYAEFLSELVENVSKYYCNEFTEVYCTSEEGIVLSKLVHNYNWSWNTDYRVIKHKKNISD